MLTSPVKRDDSVFDSVLYAFVKLILYKCSIQVFLDAAVQICVHRLGLAFCARQNHGNLVRHDLAAGDGFRYGFSLRLFTLCRNVSGKGHDAFFTILGYGDVFEAGLIERFADGVRNIG